MDSSIITKLEDIIKASGFDHFGFAPFTKALSLSFYKSWLERGHHGEMNYLKEHLKIKEDPQVWLPQAKSAIVIALNYIPHPSPQDLPIQHLKIARYARGQDYHLFLKEKLNELLPKLEQHFPNELFAAHTDSSPIMERDLGYQAQLGWFGKNSCLIHPKKGSFFLLAEILTSLDLGPGSTPVTDFCGTCSRCIDQCPTNAIRPDRTLDATQCISYLNIELKGVPDTKIIPKMGEWFFGCDICQEICPWNKKAFGEKLIDPEPTRDEKISELRYILKSSSKGLQRDFQYSPLLRRHAFGLKRNALILAFNLKAVELRPEIERLGQSNEKLESLAQWVLEQWDLSTL
jgi:epoxyqueuosine reductase